MNLDEITSIVLIGTILFISVVIFIAILIIQYQRRQLIFKKEKELLHANYQREILKTQLETREDTFHLISEELHDNIGQLLSSTRMLMGIAERSMEKVPDTFRTADQTLAKAIQDMRMLSKSLNREWLSQFNLMDNLEAEINRINFSGVIVAHLQSEFKKLPLEPESQVMLFRIIQEGIQNSIRHAKASSLDVQIFYDKELVVCMRDNGQGFQLNSETRSGVGLMNMKHRTQLLGGRIEWQAEPASGTEIKIFIPI